MTGKEVFIEFMDCLRNSPQVFPPSHNRQSWTPSITAFFYKLGTSQGYEVRCRDWHEKLQQIRAARKLTSLPGGYDVLCSPWVADTVGAHSILAIDACWVPLGFSIPRNFSGIPVPRQAEIILAFEHEDEGTLYTDGQGTNLNVVLDEVRKIGNVRSGSKIISYVTSRSEAESGRHIEDIVEEVQRTPWSSQMTDEWFIIQIMKYESPKSRKREIRENGRRVLCCRGVSITGASEISHDQVIESIAYPI